MNIERYVSYPHRSIAFQAAAGAFLTRTAGRFLRRNLHPSLEELAGLGGGLKNDAAQLLTAGTSWRPGSFSEARLGELAQEHAAVQEDLAARYRSTNLPFPTIWAVESGTSFL